MKKLFLVISVMALALLLSVCAFAATVYVADGGTGDGSSEAYPTSSLSNAISALNGEGGTIVLVGDTTHSGLVIPEQSGDLTITAKNSAKLIVASRTTIEKNTNDNTFIFDVPVKVTATSPTSLVGNFNSIVFTENFSVTLNGGSNCSFSFYGGAITNTSDNEAAITTLPYSITVNGGTFSRFECGNLRSESVSGSSSIVGAIAAPITVTVNGGTFGDVGDYSDALKPNASSNGFSLSGMSVLADGGSLTINGGTFNMPIYLLGRKGQVNSTATYVSTLTASDRKYYAADGDISLTITGGTFYGGAVVAGYTEPAFNQLIRGNVTVEVSGGSFATGTVFDATQVKAYEGEDKIASITYADGLGISVCRFDVVNGVETTYTEPTRIAFIGDSITEGHSATSRLLDSYPANYLENALADGEDVIVSNYGVSSGGMRPMAVRYYPDMLAYPICLEESGSDIYFFALGINDADYTGRSNGALEEYKSRYMNLIKEHGDMPDTDKVYITSVSPLTSATPEKRIRAFSLVCPTQEAIALELDANDSGKYQFVDLYSLLYPTYSVAPSTYLADGIHPNNLGYEVYADALYGAVKSGVYANESAKMTDIYVSDNGTRFGAGTVNSPISYFEYAISLCADEATIHVIDTITFDGNIHTPLGMTKLTIKGEGEGATLQLTESGTLFFACSPLELDNIKLVQKDLGASSDLSLIANYNSVDVTESFTNEGTLRFYAGNVVFADRSTVNLADSMHFDTVATASSSNDCTINLCGGTYTLVIGGNRLFHANAPIGTYSGNMTFNIADGVTASNETYSGINGMNYNAGTITANINGWGNIKIRDNSIISYLDTNNYDPTKNTGSIIANIAEGVGSGRVVLYDFDGSGAFNIKDVLALLSDVLNNETDTTCYYGVSEVNLKDVVNLLKRIVK